MAKQLMGEEANMTIVIGTDENIGPFLDQDAPILEGRIICKQKSKD